MLFCTLLATLPAFAGQIAAPASQDTHTAHSAAVVEVKVDGTLNPELIPDDVAYYHFFRVLARNPSMNPDLDRRRRIAYLKYFFTRDCGQQRTEDRSLSDSQTELLLAAADQIMSRTAQISSAPAGPATPPDELAAAGAARVHQIHQIVAEGVKLLPLTIDPDAAKKVHSHVLEHVKRRIRLVNVRVPYAQ